MVSDKDDPAVVVSLDRQNMVSSVPHPSGLDLTDALTVEAWVDARGTRQEALQALVSQWTPPDAYVGF